MTRFAIEEYCIIRFISKTAREKIKTEPLSVLSADYEKNMRAMMVPLGMDLVRYGDPELVEEESQPNVTSVYGSSD